MAGSRVKLRFLPANLATIAIVTSAFREPLDGQAAVKERLLFDGASFSDLPGVIVVSDDAMATDVAVRTIAQSGARHLATVNWDTAASRITEQASAPILLIETVGVADAVIDEQLPRLVAVAGPERAVVSFDKSMLEFIAGQFFGAGPSLLCDRGPGDQLAALVQATIPRNLALLDSSGEAARLARINQEVARFTETLARLTGAAPDPVVLPDTQPITGERKPAITISAGADIALAPGDIRRAIRVRRMRDEAFGLAGLFEDPAWDMMLDLFAAELEQRLVSVSSLCIAAAVAPTTALRWINKLIEVGLFERQPDELDRRRAFVALTPSASAMMRNYVAALARAGLSIA